MPAAPTGLWPRMSKKRNNPKKGRVRFALVPSPGCTCEVCLMQASKGFVFKREFNPHGGRNKSCRCRFMPGIEGETAIEGYDPDECYALWKRVSEMQLSVKPSSFEGILETVGKAEIGDMVTTLVSVGDKRAIRFFETHGNKIRIRLSNNEGIAYFSPGENVVILDVDMAVKGDNLHLPFQLIAHEGTHMIDCALGGGANLSLSYRDGALGRAIDADFAALRKAKLSGVINEAYLSERGLMPTARSVIWSCRSDGGDTHDDYQRFMSGQMTERAVYDKYLGRYIEKAIGYGDFDSELVRILQGEYGSLPEEHVANLSDMVEANTGVAKPFGAGHPAGYWLNPDKRIVEFFAEYVDSLAFNPESAKIIKEVLPKATKVVEEMLDEYS